MWATEIKPLYWLEQTACTVVGGAAAAACGGGDSAFGITAELLRELTSNKAAGTWNQTQSGAQSEGEAFSACKYRLREMWHLKFA